MYTIGNFSKKIKIHKDVMKGIRMKASIVMIVVMCSNSFFAFALMMRNSCFDDIIYRKGSPDTNGKTLIMRVLEEGAFPKDQLAQFVEYIIKEKKRSPSILDDEGKSALWYAIKYADKGTLNAIPVLLKYSKERGMYGMGGKGSAIRHALLSVKMKGMRTDIIRQLVKAGFSIDDKLCESIAHLAIISHCKEVFPLLLVYGLDTQDIDTKNKRVCHHKPCQQGVQHTWIYFSEDSSDYLDLINKHREIRVNFLHELLKDKSSYCALLPKDIINYTQPYVM